MADGRWVVGRGEGGDDIKRKAFGSYCALVRSSERQGNAVVDDCRLRLPGHSPTAGTPDIYNHYISLPHPIPSASVLLQSNSACSNHSMHFGINDTHRLASNCSNHKLACFLFLTTNPKLQSYSFPS